MKRNTEKQRGNFREGEGDVYIYIYIAKQITGKDIRAPRINPYKMVPVVQSIVVNP